VRGDGLDQAEELRGFSDIGHVLFTVGGSHFQTVTICNGFVALSREALFPIAHDHSYWGTICPPVGIQIGIALAELFDAVIDVDGSC